MAASHAPRIAILASGGGTTAEAFITACVNGTIDAKVDIVICNNAKAEVFDRVASLNKKYGLKIKTAHINGATHPAGANEKVAPGEQTVAEETAILDLLKAGKYDLIVLMGYMKRVGPKLVHEFGWRTEYTSPYQAMILNTHPGLLPETKGSYGQPAQQLTLDKKMPEAGQTLHVVAEDYDDGPILAVNKVTIEPDDTADTLFDKVRTIEKANLPTDIDVFIKNRQNYLSKGAI